MNATTEVRRDGQSFEETWGALLELAVREVFELMLGCTLTAPEGPCDETLDVTAMVGLAGQLCGVMSVYCSSKSGTIMACNMLGVKADQIGPEMYDAFGEICNMIAGNFKNKIAGLGDGCMLSVPTVITGSDYSLRSLTDAPALEVRLLFEGSPVVITLQIHN
jgi:chemotaxis protein CheX